MHKCYKCNEHKDYTEFHKDASRKSGLGNICKECSKIRGKEYRKANDKKIKKYQKEWRYKNKELLSAKKKKYYEENKERILKLMRQHYDENLEDRLAYARKYNKENSYKYRASRRKQQAERRALKMQTEIYGNQELNELVFAEAYELAEQRGKDTGVKHHVDHIIPLKGKEVSGFHVWNNLRVIPYYENCSKSNKLMEDLL